MAEIPSAVCFNCEANCSRVAWLVFVIVVLISPSALTNSVILPLIFKMSVLIPSMSVLIPSMSVLIPSMSVLIPSMSASMPFKRGTDS